MHSQLTLQHDQLTLPESASDFPAGEPAAPVVARRRGREARLLRMTCIGFAEYLGVHERTVSYWHSRLAIVPVPELQRALDTALERAPGPARERFALGLSAGGAA